MMTLTDTPALTHSETVAHFANLIMRASLQQVEQASKWYHDANAVAREVASNMTLDIERASCIVAAFSPRERWSVNVRKALQYSIGVTPAGLSNNVAMADASLVHGFDALKGQKTNAFARAIAGDESAVVIDVWMMRAASMPTDSPNKSQYNFVADAVHDAAALFGLTPRTAQALIWIIVRGGAE
jgi:hypothetical protein